MGGPWCLFFFFFLPCLWVRAWPGQVGPQFFFGPVSRHFRSCKLRPLAFPNKKRRKDGLGLSLLPLVVSGPSGPGVFFPVGFRRSCSRLIKAGSKNITPSFWFPPHSTGNVVVFSLLDLSPCPPSFFFLVCGNCNSFFEVASPPPFFCFPLSKQLFHWWDLFDPNLTFLRQSP